jgi:hypothetical protein
MRGLISAGWGAANLAGRSCPRARERGWDARLTKAFSRLVALDSSPPDLNKWVHSLSKRGKGDLFLIVIADANGKRDPRKSILRPGDAYGRV